MRDNFFQYLGLWPLIFLITIISLRTWNHFPISYDKKTKMVHPSFMQKESRQMFQYETNDNESLALCSEGMLESENPFTQSCQIVWYSAREIVSCLDLLSYQEKGKPKEKFLHFVFIGDSRIRQHFYNFIKFIPDYDLKFEPPLIMGSSALYQSVNVTSRTLNLCLSFIWQPLLDNSTAEIVSEWILNPQSYVVRVIFTGMSLHHMRRKLPAGDSSNYYQLYKQSLLEFGPILRRIASINKVIWMTQYPVTDSRFNTFHIDDIISSRKIHQYNLLAEHLLRNSGVILWNSGNSFVKEYLRGCSLIDRYDHHRNGYVACIDLIHAGYAAMSQVLQLFFNEICNKIT